jgi:N-acetylmuramate 1-kinase
LSDSTRISERMAFLVGAGWRDAALQEFPGDASTRRYARLTRKNETAILMDAPAAAEAPVCPPGASPRERAALGYNAQARLAGSNLSAFAGIANALTARGFSAPRILAADFNSGFLLLEDLGDGLYARAIDDGANEALLYEHAIDALAAIYRSSFPTRMRAFGQDWIVSPYDRVALQVETGLFLDWYVAQYGQIDISDEMRTDWDAAWKTALAALDAHAPGLALRDFHAENLLWLPDRTATSRVGLIDFQDALFAHPTYDLVSLLEDARRDVDPALAEPLKERFFTKAGLADAAAFDAAFAVMGAQRNAKILGIFVRLAKRDKKPKYLDLIPRVARHFVRDLEHPALLDVRKWIQGHAPRVFDEATA